MKTKNNNSRAKARKPKAAKPARPAKAASGKAPSQTFAITQTLQDAGRPLLLDELAVQLGAIGAAARKQLLSQLEAALQSGDLVRNRRDEYCLRERLPLIVGTVSGHRDGHGFLQPDDRSTPIVLPYRQMREVMHGDRVAVRIAGQDQRGRPEGAVVKVLERGASEIVGRLYDESRISFVVPDKPRIAHRVLVPRDRLAGAVAGQVVLLKLIEPPSRTAQPLGHVVRILGEHAAPGMETEIAIHSHGLPFEFPSEAVAEAEAFGRSVSAAAKRGREDLRELRLVTIDGEDARDFDDAVYCEEIRGGWRLIVAIADVASYVAPDSALDREAQHRGTSVYFPNRVLPMLPEALSNGLCSLNPQVDRLCMVCEINVDDAGGFREYQFFPAVMRSHARLTYTKVAAMLENSKGEDARQYESLLPHIQLLYKLFKVLLK